MGVEEHVVDQIQREENDLRSRLCFVQIVNVDLVNTIFRDALTKIRDSGGLCLELVDQ